MPTFNDGVTITLGNNTLCPVCNGRGGSWTTGSWITCGLCGGHGQSPGLFIEPDLPANYGECPFCNGTGKLD